MSNTLLGFGIFALAAAIVGGGLTAFGFKMGVLRSIRRQVALGALGITLILLANIPPPPPAGTDEKKEEFQFQYVHPQGANPQPFCVAVPSGARIDTTRVTYQIVRESTYMGYGWATYQDRTTLGEMNERRACVQVVLAPVGSGASPQQDRYPLKLIIVAPFARETAWWQFWNPEAWTWLTKHL